MSNDSGEAIDLVKYHDTQKCFQSSIWGGRWPGV